MLKKNLPIEREEVKLQTSCKDISASWSCWYKARKPEDRRMKELSFI